jgi:uncharacterized protein (TIGR03435 family)
MRRTIAVLALAAGLYGFPARGQSKLEFEVTSVKPNKSGLGYAGGCHGIDSKTGPDTPVPLGRCRITSALLTHMISTAYRIQLQDLKGGPDWVRGTDRFDVEGKAANPGTATEEQLLQMLQNLLQDRFQLVVHRETQQVSGYVMTVGRNGPKLKEVDGKGRRLLRMTGAAISKPDAIDRKNLDQNTIIGEGVTLRQLADRLSYLPDRIPVVDKTGLDGFYDFKFAWEPGESISAVLQEQLGLKLESQKVPIDVLVIDSAKMPVAN